MPRVTIRTGVLTADGREEEMSEFLCDAAGCGNIATDVVGFLKEVRQSVVMCREHANTGALVTTRKPRREST